MNKAITNSIIRFVVLLLLQSLILKQVVWGWNGQAFLQVHLYPLFILLLPIRTPRLFVILLGFAMGLLLDLPYETLGMHAAALTFTAYLRGVVLDIIEPREKYGLKDTPTKFSLGDIWFFRYAGILIFAHLFFYYGVEAFTLVYFTTILLKVFFSWIASMFFLMATVYIFNPKA